MVPLTGNPMFKTMLRAGLALVAMLVHGAAWAGADNCYDAADAAQVRLWDGAAPGAVGAARWWRDPADTGRRLRPPHRRAGTGAGGRVFFAPAEPDYLRAVLPAGAVRRQLPLSGADVGRPARAEADTPPRRRMARRSVAHRAVRFFRRRPLGQHAGAASAGRFRPTARCRRRRHRPQRRPPRFAGSGLSGDLDGPSANRRIELA